FTLKVLLQSTELGLKAPGLASLGRKCSRHHAGFTLKVLLQSTELGLKAPGLASPGRKCNRHHAGFDAKQSRRR
ncbi:MAG: hypothetical protein PUH70_00005, partial [Clostridiales bacterium]|nr:hypothetical protein [Clostridiales bacterium]MDY5513290.1 hypothetical protein [Candidatus Ventricola sp.]